MMKTQFIIEPEEDDDQEEEYWEDGKLSQAIRMGNNNNAPPSSHSRLNEDLVDHLQDRRSGTQAITTTAKQKNQQQ